MGEAGNDRRTALSVLLRAERDDTVSFDTLLKNMLREQDALALERKSFLLQVTAGTYRRIPTLDFCLNFFSKTKVENMKPYIRVLLRMSVYQILFMDSVPDAAACNEAVKLCAASNFSSLKGFVNGVLRTVAREKERIPYPKETEAGFFSACLSMPEDLAAHFIDSYGLAKAKEIAEAFLIARPVSIRLRKAEVAKAGLTQEAFLERMTKETPGVEISEHPFAGGCFTLQHTDNPARLSGFTEGLFAIQDAASALAVRLAGIREGDTVLDVCASPGGKAVYAADFTSETGKVYAFDVSDEKVEKLKETAARFHLTQMQVGRRDALLHDEALEETADVLLADLPCSALGIIGRKAEVKYRTSKAQREELSLKQRDILRNVTSYVKKGGTLLYSTCTLNPEENEETVRWLTEEYPFTPCDLTPFVPEVLKKEPSLQKGMLQLFPGVYDTDGFFIARLTRSA